MAFTLKIKLTGQSQFTDFSNFVFAEPGGPLASKTFALNSIQQLDIVLKEASGFLPPERGNEVWLDCATYSPSGELFTGFIAADPEKVLFAQEADGNLRYKWRVSCQSEESMCNFTAPLYMSTLVPFQNKTVGQIVTYLLNLLAPGRFDTSGIQAGPVIPYYLPNAQANFTDIMKELVEGAGMKFWTRRKKAFLAYFDDALIGVSALSTDPAFNPDDISITPYAQPIFNDVIGYGGEEPQVYVREYYSGDGLSMTFPLHLPAYGLTTTDLIIDDFNNSSLDLNRWAETDPTSAITEGASLFIDGGAGLNLTKVVAVQGLELAGTLFFQHGAVRFNLASSGIIGGLYSSPSAHTLANCVAGIKVLSWSAGSGTLMQPTILGKPLAPAENFDVAQSPLPSGLWSVPPSSFTLQASGGRVLSAGTTGAINWLANYYIGPSLSSYNDGYVQAKVIRVTGVNSGAAVLARCVSGALTYYHADVLTPTGGSTGLVRLYTRVNGVFNGISQVSGVAMNSGDLLRMEVSGGQVVVKLNGVTRISATDSTIPSGSWGIATSPAALINDVVMDDWESGPFSATNVPTVPGQDYILQTQVQAPERVRRLRNFSSLQTPSGFGGVDVPSNIFVSVRSLAVSVADASLPPTAVEMYNGTVIGAPTFINYVPFNSDNLNIAVNFLEVSSPMDVLAMNFPSGTGKFKTYTLGAQKEIDKDGSIVAQANQSTQNFQTLGALGLFGLQAPSAGDIVEVRYRSAGQMVARVVEPSSLVLEASRLGDSGERTGLLPQLNFAPRNQAELEFAIKSYIDDRDSPIFQGTYSFTTLRYTPPSEPIPGRFFTVNVSGTYPSFLAFANSVRTDITVESPSLPSGQAEVMNVDVTYGNLDKFQALMTQLSLQDQGGQSNINIRGVTLPASTDFALVGATTGPNITDFRYAYASPYGTNLLTNSQAFDNAAWTKSNLNPAVSADTIVAPDGTLSAESLTASASTPDAALVQNVTLGSTAYTFSVWMKVPTTPKSIEIGIRDNGGPSTDTVKLCPLTTGWQKFSVTKLITQPGTGLVFMGAYLSWVSGEVVHAWGAQLQPGSGAGPYVPTLSASSSSLFHNVDFGQAPPTGAGGDLGHFEVRYSDANWGLPGTTNLVSEVTGQQASLTRSSRSQQYFARGIVPVNLALHSGFEDGVTYLSASGANPPTGSYDATRGAGDFGCVKVVFPSGSTACSGSFTNCAITGLTNGTNLAGRVKFMASRPLTGAEELRFKLAGTFSPSSETALTSANMGSGTYSSFRDFVIGPTPSAAAFTDPGSGANASPIGGNWTTLSGTQAIQRIGGVFEPASGGAFQRCAAFYNPFTPSPNQYSEVVVARADTSNHTPGAGCRMLGSGGENGYYALVIGPLGAAAQMYIQRAVSGATLILASGVFTVASGDTIRMECSGNALTLKQNGVTRLSTTDGNLVSGNVGMFEFVNSVPITGTQISSWSGGNLGASGTDARMTVYVKSALTTPLTGWVDDVQVEKNPPAYAPSPYYKNTLLPKGYASRYASLVAINFPLLPAVPGATVDYTNVNAPVITIDPAILLDPDLFGYTITDAAGNVLVTVTGGGLLASDLVFVDQKNRTANLNYFITAINSRGESGPSFNLVATIPPLQNDGLTADSSALNLVPNGDLSVATDPTGIRCVRASAIRVQDNPALGFPSPNGWTRSFESKPNGEGAFYRNMNFAGASFAGSPFIGVAQDSGGTGQNFAAVCDAFAVRATVNYRFSAAVWPNQGGIGLGGPNTLPLHAVWYFRVLWYVVGATDFSRTSADLVSFVDVVNGSTQNGPIYPFRIIQAPSNAGYCRIAFYHWDDGTSVATGWNMVFTSVRCTALLTAFDVTPVNTSGTFTGANPLSQSGATTTILVAASTMQFADGQIGYNSGSCVAAGLGTYYVYADDPTYSGGTVTYVATPTPSNTFANNGRVYFGVITLVGGGGAVGAGGGSGGGRISLR